MALKVAFIGFQTGHAYSLYKDLADHPDVEVVAACEQTKPHARKRWCGG